MNFRLQSWLTNYKYICINLTHTLSRIQFLNDETSIIQNWLSLTPKLSAWLLRGHRALKSILWETVFPDQLEDFSLLS